MKIFSRLIIGLLVCLILVGCANTEDVSQFFLRVDNFNMGISFMIKFYLIFIPLLNLFYVFLKTLKFRKYKFNKIVLIIQRVLLIGLNCLLIYIGATYHFIFNLFLMGIILIALFKNDAIHKRCEEREKNMSSLQLLRLEISSFFLLLLINFFAGYYNIFLTL